jgi:Leucine rich repeat/Leucine Rich Repeat
MKPHDNIDEIDENYAIQLDPQDREVLDQLEIMIGRSIPVCNIINYYIVGYKIGNNRIVELNLTGCKLKSLPANFPSLTALTGLHLHYNHFTIFPEPLCYLESLNVLTLNSNHLSSLPENIRLLDTLRYLDLSYNKITRLPDSFGNLSHLRYVDLHQNSLTELPEFTGKLHKLTSLNLENNLIEELPASFCDLIMLERLYLSFNPITGLPFEFGNLRALEEFRLHNTEIITLPDSFGNLSSLKILELYNNPKLDQHLQNRSIQSIAEIYSKPLPYLAAQFVDDETSLSEGEHFRLLDNISFAARSLLEDVLDNDHPFLEEIANKYSVPIKTQNFELFSDIEKHKLFHQETGKHAIWRGKITLGYLTWEQKKLSDNADDQDIGESDFKILL